MPSWICHISALNLSSRISADWDSMAVLIPAFYIYLTAILRVAGLQKQAGNDIQLQAEILFQNVYGRGLSPNNTKPISKYLSWCVCPIHPDNPVSICIALFELTPSLLFVLSLFAGMLADKGLFLFYAFKRHCSCSDMRG